jgi:hypothetical protein
MASIFVLEAATLFVCWVVAGYVIWKWGPGFRKRAVACPEKKVRAQLIADQREAEFGCLRVTDVKSCSLLPGQELTCSKACVPRL